MIHFFHVWGRWRVYYWNGVSTMISGKMAGQTIPTSETRQRRECRECGKTQDEWLCDGAKKEKP